LLKVSNTKPKAMTTYKVTLTTGWTAKGVFRPWVKYFSDPKATNLDSAKKIAATIWGVDKIAKIEKS